MTVHYILGEVSLRLGELARLSAESGDAAQLAELRLRAERCAPHELAGLVSAVLVAVDEMCWRSLTDGGVARFDCQAAVARDFAEFAQAAHLISEDRN